MTDVLSLIHKLDNDLYMLNGTGLRAIQLEAASFNAILKAVDFRVKPGGTITGFTMMLPSGECEVRRWP